MSRKRGRRVRHTHKRRGDVVPPLDSLGRPVEVGRKYLLHYPDYFQVVMVVSVQDGAKNVYSSALIQRSATASCLRLWPMKGSAERGEVEHPTEGLTPLDPVVLGMETRALLELVEGFVRGCHPPAKEKTRCTSKT